MPPRDKARAASARKVFAPATKRRPLLPIGTFLEVEESFFAIAECWDLAEGPWDLGKGGEQEVDLVVEDVVGVLRRSDRPVIKQS